MEKPQTYNEALAELNKFDIEQMSRINAWLQAQPDTNNKEIVEYHEMMKEHSRIVRAKRAEIVANFLSVKK